MATLKQGEQYLGGTVQFDSATGQRLNAGQTTYENKDLVQNPTTGAITPASMAPAQPFTPAVPSPYTAPIVSPLPAPVVSQVPNVSLTAEEQGAIDQVAPWQTLIDNLSGSTSELAQKSFRKQQAESTGLNAAQNLSQSLYDKGQGLDLKAQAILAQKQADIQGLQNSAQMGGANVTKGGLAPQQRGIETRSNQLSLENTLAKLDNAVSYYASTGKVREAQQAVDQAVDAEFTPKLIALDTAQRNLASLLKSPTLTTAQQKQALNLQAQYTAQETAIKEAAQVKKDTGDARIKALLNNPNITPEANDVLSMAQTPEQVAQVMQFFKLTTLSEADRLQQSNADRNYAQSQRQFNQSQSNANRAFAESQRQFDIEHKGEAPAGSVVVSSNGVPTTVNEDLAAYAERYASGEKVSPAELKLAGITMGQVSELAKSLPKPDGAIIDNSTGIKPTKLTAEREIAVAAMNEIVTKTMPALQDRFGKINTGILGGLGGMVWTSQDRQDYDTFRQEFLSKLLAARSGAAVTEQEYARYAKMLPSNFNQMFFLGSDGSKKLNSLSDSMRTSLDNVLSTSQVSVVGYSDTKKMLDQLSPEQMAELTASGATIPAWYKPKEQ